MSNAHTPIASLPLSSFLQVEHALHTLERACSNADRHGRQVATHAARLACLLGGWREGCDTAAITEAAQHFDGANAAYYPGRPANLKRIPYSPFAPEQSDLLRAARAVLNSDNEYVSEVRKLHCLKDIGTLPDEENAEDQAKTAWRVAGALGLSVPTVYGATSQEQREHVARWPAESLIDALNAITGKP